MSRVDIPTPAARGELAPTANPSERFDQIRALLRRAEGCLLDASVLLAGVHASGEWRELGFGSFTAYAGALEIRQDVASKMLRIGQTFSEHGRPMWKTLPARDQAELSIERVYTAARRVDAGQVDRMTALHDAVAHPPAWQRAMLKGTEPLDHHPCVCPTCGTRHWTA
jgi:hypothetical protein